MQFDATETVAAALDEGSRRQTLLQGVKKSREALERGERELLKEADALPVLRDSYVKGISLESGVRRR